MAESKLYTANQEILRSAAKSNWLQWLAVVGLVYLLICAVGIIGSGFKLAAGDQAKELFAFATNPFAGLVVGTIATALIQSSSTVTSIIVGLVAGGLPVSVALLFEPPDFEQEKLAKMYRAATILSALMEFLVFIKISASLNFNTLARYASL